MVSHDSENSPALDPVSAGHAALLRTWSQARRRAVAAYPRLWRRCISEWRRQGDCVDRAWTIYGASFLFQTGGLRWAMDPVLLPERTGATPDYDAAAADLDALSLVVLTHAHADHFSPDLLNSLAHLPIEWVIPDHMLAEVRAKTRLAGSRIRVARDGDPVEVQGMRLLPFSGAHVQVRATGYLIDVGGRRLVFPGDTRDYRARPIPDAAEGAVLFANVWLGRAQALAPDPACVAAAAAFALACRPSKIFLTHLHDVGRAAEDYWHEAHAAMLRTAVTRQDASVAVEIARLGASMALGRSDAAKKTH